MIDHPIRLLTAREIDCRISQVRKTGIQLLLYKDARVDMAILDETFGPMNWQRHHTRDNANCIISIWDAEKGCWVDKEDVGTESNTEAQKGLASDSFKRAGVNWGIGRELYTAPFIWIQPPNCTVQESNGKYQCYDRFEVQDIGYNGEREINKLVIINSKTRSVVYEMGKAAPKPTAPKPTAPTHASHTPEDEPEIRMPTCERCNKVITGVVLPDGTTMTAPELIGKSKLTYNGIYCFDCMKVLKKKRKAG